jgi:hypothetical protein
VTVDVEPPVDGGKPADWREYFHDEAGDYFNEAWKTKDFARSNLPRRNIDVLWNAIQAGIAGRATWSSSLSLAFSTKTGTKWLRLGGIIGGNAERRKVRGSDLAKTGYYRDSFAADPCVITVPRLTRKSGSIWMLLCLVLTSGPQRSLS